MCDNVLRQFKCSLYTKEKIKFTTFKQGNILFNIYVRKISLSIETFIVIFGAAQSPHFYFNGTNFETENPKEERKYVLKAFIIDNVLKKCERKKIFFHILEFYRKSKASLKGLNRHLGVKLNIS